VIVLDMAVILRIAGDGGVFRDVLVMGAAVAARRPVSEPGTHGDQRGRQR
jgi:hypothetical protein